MKLSVIIPTFNRAKLLYNALLSIVNQTIDQNCYEVIVIDNGSNDNTKEVVNSFKEKICNLKYFYESTPGLHIGRHIGLKESNTDLLVYADDDIEAFPTWLEAINESFKDEKTVLVGGNNLPKYEIIPPIWTESLWSYNEFGKLNGFYSLIDFGDKQKEINPDNVFGCNFSIRKKVLLEFGGFHPDGMPRDKIRYRGDGESYISRKICERKYRTIFNPKASVYHFVSKNRTTKEYMYYRGFIQGISDSFTKIRESYINIIENQKVNSILKKTLNRILNRDIKNDLKLIKDNIINIENDYKLSYKIGHSDGLCFHQNEVNSDPILLKWVLKDSYIEYNKDEY